MRGSRTLDVTVVAASSIAIRRTIAALRRSVRSRDFASALLITDATPSFLDRRISLVPVPRIVSADAYSRYVLTELHRHVKTSHCLIVQADGYVVNPSSWRDDFLDYDYIGAPWPDRDAAFRDQRGGFQRVGNGGFSLRSTRLMKRAAELARGSKDWDRERLGRQHFEDVEICVALRPELEADGFRYAPVEVAAQFATERMVPETVGRPFGFHGVHPHRRGWSRTDALWGWSFVPVGGVR